jgi:hypothetical protein
MSSHSATYQQIHTVSIRKEAIIERLLIDDKFSKDELRVILLLLTKLDGYKEPENYARANDPYNFKAISIKQISSTLDIKSKKVEKIIDYLVDEDVLEKGSNDSVKKGYRFTF